jgi:hypothetical protein
MDEDDYDLYELRVGVDNIISLLDGVEGELDLEANQLVEQARAALGALERKIGPLR